MPSQKAPPYQWISPIAKDFTPFWDAYFRDAVMSVHVQVFGRRQRRSNHTLRWPASEKRQGTKSRDGDGGGAAGYGDFAAGSGVDEMERRGSARVTAT